MTLGSFEPGAALVWRSIRDGHVATVRAFRVVRDEPGEVALCLCPGYPYLQRTGVRGGPRARMLVEWDGGYRERTWTDNRALVLYRPGEAHSVELFWRDTDRAFLGWHVNLQLPWRRTALGFDSRDLVLDVSVAPDGSAAWKDEDELAFAVEHGQLGEAEARLARDEGERALERVRRRERPFDGALASWLPETVWPPPALPAGCERL